METITISLADKSFNAGLKHFCSELGTSSAISLKLEREGEFLDSFAIEGETTDILVAHSEEKVVGLATYSQRACFSGESDEPIKVGLFGNLRLAAPYRSTITLGRGLKLFRQQHEARGKQLIITVIQEDNKEVLELLTSHPKLLPRFVDEGRILSLVIDPLNAIKSLKKRALNNSLTIRRATQADLPSLLGLLKAQGSKKRFFPVYVEADFKTKRLNGLDISDFRLAFSSSGKLVGALAGWNQLRFRRWVIQHYDKITSGLRRGYNLFARISGKIELPAPGRALPLIYLSMPCVINDDPEIFLALVHSLCDDFQGRTDESGAKFLLIIGLHEKDPFLNLLLPAAGRVLTSRLFSGSWEPDIISSSAVPFIDLATI